MPRRIDIRGVIVSNDDQWIYDWLEIESTSPAQVTRAIQEAGGDDLEIYINSPGGDVYAGSEIYTLLKEYAGNVTVKITGIAASAASVIAMAGKKVMISPTAQIMIHNVSSVSIGDYRAHAHESDVVRNWNKSIANAYRLKSGMSEAELLKLMNQETWLNAQQALDMGFVDEIMFDEGETLKLAASVQVLPRQVIDKIRNEFLKKKGEMVAMPNENKIQNAAGDAQQAAQYPSQQPQAAGASAANIDVAAQERARLQAIDAIAANIDPQLVHEAKYGPNPMTAEQLALRAIQEGKLLNNNLFERAVAANQAATASVAPGVSPANGGGDVEIDLSTVAGANAYLKMLDRAALAGSPIRQ